MGGRRTKLPPAAASRTKAQPEQPAGTGDPLDRVEAHLMRTLELVEGAIARGEASPATVRESANCARAIVNLSAERRARLKQDRARIDHLTLAEVMRWLRDAGQHTQRTVLRELRDIVEGREGSILA